MGAIVAYKDLANNEDPEDHPGKRRIGQKIFGEKLKALTHPVTSEEIRAIVKDCEDNDNIRLFYFFQNDPDVSPLELEDVETRGPNFLTCELDDNKFELVLRVQNDQREVRRRKNGNVNGTKLDMSVNFPDAVDHSFAYIEGVAEDIVTIVRASDDDDPGNAQAIANVHNYLIAFKFMSRCK